MTERVIFLFIVRWIFGYGGHFNRLNPLPHFGFFFHPHFAQVVVSLQIDPELRLHAEKDAEGECGRTARRAIPKIIATRPGCQKKAPVRD